MSKQHEIGQENKNNVYVSVNVCDSIQFDSIGFQQWTRYELKVDGNYTRSYHQINWYFYIYIKMEMKMNAYYQHTTSKFWKFLIFSIILCEFCAMYDINSDG